MKSKLKSKIREYVSRYLVAEVLGTLMAVLFSTVAFVITENKIVAAIAGTWGENLGFYAAVVTNEVLYSRKEHRLNQKSYNALSFAKNIRNIFIEFGPSEILDSFLVRPAAMYFFTSIIANFQVGIVVGKIAADLIFYLPVLVIYELKKKHLK